MSYASSFTAEQLDETPAHVETITSAESAYARSTPNLLRVTRVPVNFTPASRLPAGHSRRSSMIRRDSAAFGVKSS